ncbi:MAG: hypothetical protein A2X05_01790 [Bacteroidetes bacterium GWE2_41_25]|nr:MAG: hypothetical protein A2X03_08660 [Bacteroidetes bacterium GWA2_40_15]OFX95942.1 MAG: hypothetical protein A2X05_01790 [Bacteroidetes bacterium GWE2_41_25]OFX96039.1 MAG: hypothetical protein A2X06_00465 [Bacteroidetes bacterium GWC2_40_22]OFY60685.1 MAG: hypothetical protein A2X04_13200 [Bacteroidetes bacterium GWF2_41_9]HAM09366.1 hypothetical protein [Bacteroidales bacterium]
MKEFIRKYLIEIIFSVAGAIGGFLYWKFIGCLSGTCVIKSVWYMSTLYGGMLGWVISSLGKDLILRFKKEKKYDQ